MVPSFGDVSQAFPFGLQSEVVLKDGIGLLGTWVTYVACVGMIVHVCVCVTCVVLPRRSDCNLRRPDKGSKA